MKKYKDLIVLSHRSRLNKIDDEGHIFPDGKDDIDHVKYISQGLEIDLKKGLYRTIFGADHRGSYIQNGFTIRDGWNRIGDSIIPRDGSDFGDGIIGIYDRTNFRHVKNMVYDAVVANTDYSNAD